MVTNLKIAAVALSQSGQTTLSTIIDHGLNGGPRPRIAEFYRNLDTISPEREQLEVALKDADCILYHATRKGDKVVHAIEQDLVAGPRPCILFVNSIDPVSPHLKNADKRYVRLVVGKGEGNHGQFFETFAGFKFKLISNERLEAKVLMATVLEIAQGFANNTLV